MIVDQLQAIPDGASKEFLKHEIHGLVLRNRFKGTVAYNPNTSSGCCTSAKLSSTTYQNLTPRNFVVSPAALLPQDNMASYQRQYAEQGFGGQCLSP